MDGVIVAESGQSPAPNWLTAIDFMSGAVIAVQAASAHAGIEAILFASAGHMRRQLSSIVRQY